MHQHFALFFLYIEYGIVIRVIIRSHKELILNWILEKINIRNQCLT